MHPEYQYIDLVRRISAEGFYRPSPHKPLPSQPDPPGTFSLMNENLVFDLSDGSFPLLTTRRSKFELIASELLWYLSGSTNNHDLHAIGDVDNSVWDDWDTEETNQSLGWAPGQLGPIYGFQWRHFGAEMIYPRGEIAGLGYDQIRHLVEGIIENPNSKRHLVVAYNPRDMKDCFVTTCHGTFFCQVWGDRLNLHMIQRSGDVPIGIPFNIACYALLLLMLSQVTGLKPGKFHHTISDAHLYENQIEPMKKLFEREPYAFPSVKLNPEVKDIFKFTMDDFELVDYEAHPYFKVPVTT